MTRKRVHRVREARSKYGSRADVVSATEFKKRCLELIDRIQQTRESITVTRYGKPVARLTAVDAEERRSAWGWMSGSVVAMDDIVAPTGEVWEANE